MSIPLLSDEVTVTLVELYAARRGINCNEALRRLVRTGLGVDPVGSWEDRRCKDGIKLIAAARRMRPARRKRLDVPEAHQEMFLELKKKLGATEARRLTLDHAALVAKRAQNAGAA